MSRRKDLMGQRFGKLVVIGWQSGAKRDGAWLCRCDCGKEHLSPSNHLTTGRTLSCGCNRPARHGGSKTRTYRIWQTMIARCQNTSHKNYPGYGARGITVCHQWNDFPAFLADMGEVPVRASIERIDNDAGYEPNNCRWATQKEQARNTRRTIFIEYRGKRQSLAAWAEELNVNYWLIHGRHKRGWSPERIFSNV